MNEEARAARIQAYQDTEAKLRANIDAKDTAIELLRRDLLQAEQDNAMLQTQLHDQDEEIKALNTLIQYWRNRTRHWMMQLEKIA